MIPRLARLRLTLVGILALWLLPQVPSAAATRLGTCEHDCSVINVNCNTPCIEGYDTESTCGAFTGGYCGNTCDETCSIYTSGSESCNDFGGGSTSCGSYGTYLTCGDGACAVGYETHDSCSADCPAPVFPTTESSTEDEDDVAIMVAMADELANNGGMEDSYEGYAIFLATAKAFGFLDPSDDVTLDFDPDGDNVVSQAMPALSDGDSISDFLARWLVEESCQSKDAKVSKLNSLAKWSLRVGGAATRLLPYTGGPGTPAGAAVTSVAAIGYIAAGGFALGSFLFTALTPCSVY